MARRRRCPVVASRARENEARTGVNCFGRIWLVRVTACALPRGASWRARGENFPTASLIES